MFGLRAASYELVDHLHPVGLTSEINCLEQYMLLLTFEL
jgi:hypothetical protein